MKIEISDHEGRKIIVPFGEIDMHTSPELRRELLKEIDRKIPFLIVDLQNVSYIDSSGIATFVEGLKTMRSYGGRLKLVSISDDIMEIFRFSRLDSVFEICGSIDDAVID